MFQCPDPIINIPAALPNHEWWKILVSALAGLLVGLLGDVVKSAVGDWLKSRRIRKRLNEELRRMLNTMKDLKVKNVRLNREAFLEVTKTSAFEHYWEMDQSLFYEDAELYELSGMFNLIEKIRQHTIENLRGSDTLLSSFLHLGMQDIFSRVELFLSQRHLDGYLL